jgi:hypothetical protein
VGGAEIALALAFPSRPLWNKEHPPRIPGEIAKNVPGALISVEGSNDWKNVVDSMSLERQSSLDRFRTGLRIQCGGIVP